MESGIIQINISIDQFVINYINFMLLFILFITVSILRYLYLAVRDYKYDNEDNEPLSLIFFYRVRNCLIYGTLQLVFGSMIMLILLFKSTI